MAEPTVTPEDRAHLDRARELARLGWGRVHPNPLVGCVLVRDSEVIGEGFHGEFGGPHAEVAALENARGGAEGATVYVTLEPCKHHAKTPPCAAALLEAGVGRVVFGARDPGAESGGGADVLRSAGVRVDGPVWSDREARAENPAFFHRMRRKSPFVALKLAMSLDAALARRPGEPTRITGPEAEREVHRLRAGFDAVLVGAGTVRSDDPRLTSRLASDGLRTPRRVLLVSDASVPEDAAVFEDIDVAPVHVFASDDVPEGAKARLVARGAHVHPVGRTASGLDVDEVMAVCWGLGITSVLCEGGASLAGTLLREQRVHRLYLFVAPTTLGSGSVSAFGSEAGALRWDAYEPAFAPELHGRDTLIVFDRRED